MSKTFKQHARCLVQLGLLFLFCLCYFLIFHFKTELVAAPNTYQARDIARAIELYFNGKLILHGPELSGGGFLPGPAYYFLIGAPYSLTKSVNSIYIFQYILFSLALVSVWWFLTKKFNSRAGLIFYFTALTSPFFQAQMADFINPSYQFIFLAWALIFFNSETNIKNSALGALFLGLSVQMHYAGLILLPAFIIKVTLDKNISVYHKIKSLGSVVFTYASICGFYIYFVLFNTEAFTSALGLNSWTLRLIESFQAPWRPPSIETVVETGKFFLHEIYCITPALLLFFRKKIKQEGVIFLWLIFILSTILFLSKGFNFLTALRYYIPFFFVAVILFSIYISRLKIKRAYVFACLAVFWIYNAQYSKNFPLSNEKYTFYSMSLGEQKKIIQAVLAESGWSYEYFLRHSYFEGLSPWADFSILYQEMYNKNKSSFSENKYDGLLALKNYYFAAKNDVTELDIGVRQEKLPSVFAQALSEKRISCATNIEAANYRFCFYNFKNRNETAQWNNIGRPYKFVEEYQKIDTGAALKIYSDRRAQFLFNYCKIQSNECYVHFDIELVGNKTLKLEIVGAPLTVFDPFNLPFWSWRLRSPEIQVVCDENKLQVLKVADEMGFGDKRTGFATPFKDYYILNCDNPKSLSLRIQDSVSVFLYEQPKAQFSKQPVNLTWSRRL